MQATIKKSKTRTSKNLDANLIYAVYHYRAAHFFASLDFPMQSMKTIPLELLRLLEKSSTTSEIWTCGEFPSSTYFDISTCLVYQNWDYHKH